MDEQNNFRNFVIISHIDHGKSTLSDRFLELTGTIPKEKMKPQFLDLMPLEREKGITIKMQPVRMKYGKYILNLIDTPGHVDFSYEVSRSLAAVEGAILLVDAVKGIQAQTISNLELAKKQNLVIIPVINKIDLPQAKIEETKQEIATLLNVSPNEVLTVSAKTGINMEELLEAVIKKIPPPKGNNQDNFRALIFDSKYDSYKGVIAFCRIVDGEIETGDKIYLIQGQASSEAKEVGYFVPNLLVQKKLIAGEIGYIATGIKEIGKVRVGDTITKISNFKLSTSKVEPLPGYKEPQPMVFASIYPESPDDYDLLKEALAKLKLSDAALVFEQESRDSLGRGYRCGFLGSLHGEIVSERLYQEFGLNLVISTPSAVCKIIDKKGREISIYSPSDFPVFAEYIKEIKEPWVRLEVTTPQSFLGRVLELLESLEGKNIETNYISQDKVVLIYEVPLREIIKGFYDNLKSLSQGFASANYKFLEYRIADLVKLEVLIAGKKEEAFSKIVPKTQILKEGRQIVEKLKRFLPSQLFSVPLQAVCQGKVIARETIRARGKDVIAPLYGGDYTRKKKLLEKQKKGKKELKEKGQVQIPSRVFLEIFKS